MNTDIQDLIYRLGGTFKGGHGQAPCPVCQPERRRDQIALSVSEGNGKLLLYCFKAGCSFVEIANAAELPLGSVQNGFPAQEKTKRKLNEYAAAQLAKARSLWDVSDPIRGTKGEAYLRGRGITCDLPGSLRWRSDIYHAPSSTWGMAMVANVEPTGGIHRTYIDKNGERLAKSAKLMMGPCAGGAVRLSDGCGPLVVCEGVETGLSLLSGLLSGPTRVWAALSTSGIKSLNLPSSSGKLIIATDGDEPGRTAGNSLAIRATALGWKVSLLPAPDGRDWNDVLVAKGGAI